MLIRAMADDKVRERCNNSSKVSITIDHPIIDRIKIKRRAGVIKGGVVRTRIDKPLFIEATMMEVNAIPTANATQYR
jgi:hypothetical protein